MTWPVFKALARSSSAVAAVEFGLSLPLLVIAAMWGTECMYLVMTDMRISQIAMEIADNASRIGDQSQLTDRKIYESDIDDLLQGANIEAGPLGLFTHGRVIVSSLEVVPGTTSQQYLHWQRCKGTVRVTSAYGAEGKGLDGSLTGVGASGAQVTATSGDAVILVEVTYTYQPLISKIFTPVTQIRTTATFNVRDDRDLTQIYQRNTASPDPVAACSTYSA